jgi:hypothetical protein
VPDVLRCFDDECAGVSIEFVSVRLEPAPLRLFECKRKGVEEPPGSEPDVTTLPALDLRLKDVSVFRPHRAGNAVARDKQVTGSKGSFVDNLRLEHQPCAEPLAASLQNIEKPLAADAAEPVSAGRDRAALEMDVDVVPVAERVEDIGVCFRIGGRQVAEGLIGEHDAPAKRVVGPIAFDDGDVVPLIGLLQQQRQVKAGRAAPDTNDTHAPPWSCSQCNNFMVKYFMCQVME